MTSAKEDQRLLTVSGALPGRTHPGRGNRRLPHTAIREDASINLEAIDRMLGAVSRRRRGVCGKRRRQPGRDLPALSCRI